MRFLAGIMTAALLIGGCQGHPQVAPPPPPLQSETPAETPPAPQVIMAKVLPPDGPPEPVPAELTDLVVTGNRPSAPANAPCPSGIDALASFISANTGWVLCKSTAGAGSQAKWLYRTHDGGAHWELVADAVMTGQPGIGGLYAGGYASAIFFLDEETGWLGHARGGLLVTHDGGRSWKGLLVPPGGELFIKAIRFLTREHGYVSMEIGGQALVQETRDGGATWTQVWPALAPATPLPMVIRDASHWLTGGSLTEATAVLRTADGGQTWERLTALPGNTLLDMVFTDDLTGYAVTESWTQPQWTHSLYRTRDGGQTWTLLQMDANAVSFPAAATGYIVRGQTLYVTHDGGVTLEPVATPERQGWAYQFVTPEAGWRIQNGQLECTADGGRTWAPLPFAQRALSYHLLPGGTAWAVGLPAFGQPNQLWTTGDGGETWTQVDLGAELQPQAVRFIDAANGLITDQRGALYGTADGGHTWKRLH